MSLDEYERQCPAWRALMARQEQECIRDLQAKYGKGDFKEMDAVLNRICERMRSAEAG